MNKIDTDCHGGMRTGAALEHGRAHAQDHQSWSRRKFLYTAGAAAGSSVMIGSVPVSAHVHHPMLSQLRDLETNRSLVLVQMFGGYDGLNTIIPVDDPAYVNARPNIRIARNEAVMLDSQFGLHPSLSPLAPLWNEGKMAVVHNVGYPDQNLSHFRATDIWTSSSAADVYWTDGWVGRTMELEFPDFAEDPPARPLAVEIGSQPSAIALGTNGQTGVVIKSPEDFYRIAATGYVFDPSDVPPTMAGIELTYLREVANQANRYAGKINEAANLADNLVGFPNTRLAESLAIISRLVRGGLGSHVYIVRIAGWDTHSNQLNRMTTLFNELGPAIQSFWADLAAGNAEDDVLMMTFSEFGRRLNQNLSQGTDHGTSNPMMLFGSDANLLGGFHGEAADLSSLDSRGNPVHGIDFRNVYGTVLTDWLGVECQNAEDAIGKTIDDMSLISPEANSGDSCGAKLPVELQAFRVRQDGDQVIVAWETASEVENAGFEVQVATGDRIFEQRAWVDGKGTSESGSAYSIELALHPGDHLFRLRQVDFDGTASYSEVLSLSVEVVSSIMLIPPYPNPVSTRATISFAVRESSDVKMDLFDAQGRHVRTLSNKEAVGGRTYQIQFNAIDLASGVYAIRTMSGHHTRTDAVVVSR